MRNISFSMFLLLVVCSIGLAQEPTIDVLHLKNGSIIKGNIIELDPSSHVRIELQDGSILVFQMEELTQITKEVISLRPPMKSPGAALALSLVLGGITPIQGTGQFYNGETGKGIGYLTIGLISTAIAISGVKNDNGTTVGLGALLYLVSYAVGGHDSYVSAKRINRENGYEGY